MSYVPFLTGQRLGAQAVARGETFGIGASGRFRISHRNNLPARGSVATDRHVGESHRPGELGQDGARWDPG